MSKNYKKIPIWENKKRIKQLAEFRNEVITYFNSKENRQAQEMRAKINEKIDKIHYYFNDTKIEPSLVYRAPPAIGGYKESIDLLVNIFNLHRFPEISPHSIIDFIDRLIGVYKNDTVKSFFRTINPLWWIFLLIEFIAGVPFKILESAGLNREKIESSILGKIIKAILELIFLIAAVFGILDFLEKRGYLETIISSLKRLLNL